MAEEWKWQDHYPDELSFAQSMYSDAHKTCHGVRWVPSHTDVDRLWEEIDELYAESNRRYDEWCARQRSLALNFMLMNQ